MRDNLIRMILFVFLGCTTAWAQPAPATTSNSTGTEGTQTTSTMVMESDSRETQQKLRELFQRHPPQVARVLKLDPTLWTNREYLAHYPAIAAFAAAHPEVQHSPAFYLESIWVPTDGPPESPSIQLWRNAMESMSIISVMAIIAFALTWLIKTVVEQRRWSRLSKTQAEVHNKLLDRFGSNEELLAYIQTSPGRRFLESAPITLEESAGTVRAPLNRILWSVQAGLVILALGLGLQFVSWNAQKEVSEMTAALGSIAIAIGLGFVVSAGASMLLSRRLGLWQPPAGNENPAP